MKYLSNLWYNIKYFLKHKCADIHKHEGDPPPLCDYCGKNEVGVVTMSNPGTKVCYNCITKALNKVLKENT
jgi:hypothetical protein